MSLLLFDIMNLFSIYYVIYAFVLIILFLFVKYCRNTLKLYNGYPVLHLIPYPLYCQAFGKIPKDVPFSSFVLKYITETCMRYKKEGLCMAYITGPALFIFGEETVKVFSNEKSADRKPDEIYLFIKEALGPGLITNSGKKWKDHRKMLNPAFSLGMLKDKVPLFNEHAQALIKDLEILDGKPTCGLMDIIKCHYFNALSESVFGFKQTEENRVENLKFFHNFEKACTATIYRIMHPWLQWKFMLRTFPYGRQTLRVYEEMYNFTKNSILKIKEHVSSNRTTSTEYFNKSFTYILLKHHLNDPSFTFEDVHGEATNFLLAGYESVSTTTMWCLFILGLYPEIQEKAYNEIHFASTTSYVSFEDCSNLTYLEAVIMETLRLYPTVPLFSRKMTKDVQCGKRKIPKDTTIVFCAYVLHRNPDIYPDPETFDPERFLGSRRSSGSYIPFAEGYRNCIGKKYALIEMKIFLAYFLRNFKIMSLDKREDVELCWNIVLMPAKPLCMQIQRR